MARVGVVTGLHMEAAAVRWALKRRPPEAEVLVACHGPGPIRARAAAQALLDDGAKALASVGLAGGLKPILWPGTVVVARDVVTAGGTLYRSDEAWRGRLIRRLMGDDDVVEGRLFGTDAPVLSAAEKAQLFADHEASAVDMESHAVAAVAEQAQVPFAAVRAVADAPERSVPALARNGMREDGTVTPWPVMARLLGQPWRLPAMLATALETRRGLVALRRVLLETGAVGGVAMPG